MNHPSILDTDTIPVHHDLLVTAHIAKQVLDFFEVDGGKPSAGSFMNALFETFVKADTSNFRKLELGFPAQAQAVHFYTHINNGVDALREIARGK